MRRTCLAVLLPLCLAAALSAQTTIHLKNTVKVGPQIPASLIAQLKSSGLPAIPPETVVIVDGTHGYLSGTPFAYLYDFGAKQVTLLDTVHHQYVTVPIVNLATALAGASPTAMPPPPAAMAQAMQGVKFNVVTKATGRTDTILGIGVVETDVTLSVSMDPAASGGAPPEVALLGPMQLLQVDFSIWRVSTDELMRRPELRAWSDDFAAMSGAANMSGLLQKMLPMLPPDSAQPMRDAVQALTGNTSPTLRSRMTLRAPFLAQLAALMGNDGGGANGADLASNDPLVEFDSEASAISNDAVDDAQLAIPPDCHPVAMDVFIKTAMPMPDLSKLTAGLGGAVGGPGRGGRGGRRGGGAAIPRAALHVDAAPNAGRPVPAADLAWLASPGATTADLRAAPDFQSMLPELVPGAVYHFGVDMPLRQAFERIFARSATPLRVHDQRFVLASTAHGAPAAFLWFDRQTGTVFGGILFTPSNGEPTPSLTVFSNQIGDHITRLSQLPASFGTDLDAWQEEGGAPAILTRYFINSAGVKSVLAHDEDFCRVPSYNPAHATSCSQMNLVDARRDLVAVEYLLRRGQAPDSQTVRDLDAGDAQWKTSLAGKCGAAPEAACELRETRARVEDLQQSTLP